MISKILRIYTTKVRGLYHVLYYTMSASEGNSFFPESIDSEIQRRCCVMCGGILPFRIEKMDLIGKSIPLHPLFQSYGVAPLPPLPPPSRSVSDYVYNVLNSVLCLFRPGDVVDIGPEKFDDINIIAGALKLYLRMLPLPVITFETYNTFIDAVRKCRRFMSLL